jgi:hypothetical protein
LTVNGDLASESLLAEFDDAFILPVESVPAGTVTITYDITVPAPAMQGKRYSFDGLAQTGEDDDQTTVGGESALVVGGGAPMFEVSLSSVPAPVSVGETPTVEASVTNIGDIVGTQAVGFAVNRTGQRITTTALGPWRDPVGRVRVHGDRGRPAGDIPDSVERERDRDRDSNCDDTGVLCRLGSVGPRRGDNWGAAVRDRGGDQPRGREVDTLCDGHQRQ